MNGLKRLSALERLIHEGKQMFPASQSMVAKWAEAKLAVADRQPKVRIGIETHRTGFPRTLREAGMSNTEFA